MFFFFKQKTAYEMRISDWSSDVCSSDLSQAQNRFPHSSAHDPRGSGIEDFPTPGGVRNSQRLQSGRFWRDFKRSGRSRCAGWPGPLSYVTVPKIGRASCRESVCQLVYTWGVGGACNNTKIRYTWRQVQ